jgi:hypothetical protein
MTFFYDLNKRLSQLASKQDLQESKVAESEKWIQKAVNPANKGGLHKALHVAQGEKIPKAKIEKATHSKNPKLRHMAQFAKNVANEEMADEGNAFTGALAKTPKGGKFKVGGKKFTDTSSIEEGFKEMDAWLASREKEKGTGKFDKKERTLPGGMKATTYTRKHDDEEDSDDEETKSSEPKRRGRPKSAKSKDSEHVTKGSYKYKMVNGKRVKKEKTKEDLDSDSVMMTRPSNMSSEGIDPSERGEYDDEAGMAKDSLHTIVRHAKELERALHSNENLPEWVQEKIGQIKGMMSSVTDYILSTHERDVEQHTGREGITIEPVAEKAVSKAQRKFMGMAHAIQKGEKIKGASPELKKVAKTMKPSDTHDFAATKEKGLPKKVKAKKDESKEEKVDETTVAGSVAPVQNAAPKGKGGMQFGKGVYEGYNKQFNQALTESIHIESKMDECGDDMGQGIVIKADGEEAAKLMQLLKLAGLEGCPTCGRAPCGCNELEENKPDWPTNTETINADPNLRTYSGGLNGPKSTGQTTIPVIASQLRRQASMEESVELERTLFKTWKNYKG